MIILSWDVGIINLAYCLIDFSETTKILDWDIINLLEEEDNNCHGFINQENKKCNCIKPPKYEYINGNDTYKFCTLHKKQFEKIENNTIDIKNYKGQSVCQSIKSNKEICNKQAKFEMNHSDKLTHYCKLHSNNFIKKNNIIRKIVKQNASKAPIEIIKFNLIKSLDKINFNNIDYVLIENQPSMKNPKMKSVADTLYSWFLIRGIVDKKINNLKKVLYLSPSNKLKINDKDLNKEINQINDKTKKYKFTKETAVIYTKKILKNDKWYDFLDNNKKKDDLCDCFLQGIYFLNNQKNFI